MVREPGIPASTKPTNRNARAAGRRRAVRPADDPSYHTGAGRHGPVWQNRLSLAGITALSSAARSLSSALVKGQQDVGIQHTVGIERALDRSERVDLRRR